jgi:hypothetical protein
VSNNLNEIVKRLEVEINQHGHAFQYAVIRHANALFDQRLSRWRAPVPEFPIEVQGASGRIDVILQAQDTALFLIIEAKRSNPALSNWCFLKAPDTDGLQSKTVVAETIHLKEPARFFTTIGMTWSHNDVYHLAYEVKSSSKGDSQSKGKGGIERAVTQVLRGLNGMIEFLSTNPQFLKKHGSMTFLPVIVTTATMLISDVKLTDTNLQSGEVSLDSDSISPRDWLFYNYPQSPGLKHSVPSRPKSDSFSEILANEYVRSIAVVNPNGLQDFLSSPMWE